MRIAHFSDLHVLALDGVSKRRFFNKRFTGWVNLRVKRAHKHRPGHVRAVAREIARAKVDHVVITGDLTNLALEQEFIAVRALLVTSSVSTPTRSPRCLAITISTRAGRCATSASRSTFTTTWPAIFPSYARTSR